MSLTELECLWWWASSPAIIRCRDTLSLSSQVLVVWLLSSQPTCLLKKQYPSSLLTFSRTALVLKNLPSRDAPTAWRTRFGSLRDLVGTSTAMIAWSQSSEFNLNRATLRPCVVLWTAWTSWQALNYTSSTLLAYSSKESSRMLLTLGQWELFVGNHLKIESSTSGRTLKKTIGEL